MTGTRVTPYRKRQGLDSNTDEYHAAYSRFCGCVLTLARQRLSAAHARRARAYGPEICDAGDRASFTSWDLAWGVCQL